MLMAIANQLIALIIAAVANILMGVYNNIGKEGFSFSWKLLLQGVMKAVIIVLSFLAIAYCFDVTDLSAIGVTPDLVVNAAIVLYVTKALHNMMKVLGVESIGTTINNKISTVTNKITGSTTAVDTSTNTVRKNFDDSVG